MKYLLAPTIFLCAFLLFQVELIVGKELLPWFGGAPAVWTTCLLFFQCVLLAGYAFAHLLSSRGTPRRQVTWHGIAAGLSLILLLLLGLLWPSPITPGPSWKPAPGGDPLWQLAGLLLVSVGIPFFVLAGSGPLIQRWSVSSRPGRSPYRLYALSNAGSLLGLLSYPFLVEPLLALREQALCWTALYALFAVGLFFCARLFLKGAGVAMPAVPGEEKSDRVEQPVRGARQPAPGYTRADMILWGALAAVASALLLATTNHMCQDTAVIPLLWVFPLSLYLLTFILCFSREGIYLRWLFPPLFCGAFALSAYVVGQDLAASLPLQIASDAAVLFTGCMVCHGELVRAKPAGYQLTGFYLAVAAGGAAGAVAVALGAPRLFNGFWEFQISLVAVGVLFLLALLRDRRSFIWKSPVLIGAGLAVLVLSGGGVLLRLATGSDTRTVFAARNFYGLLRVQEDSAGTYIKLLHGRITHGFQYTDSALALLPTSYYSRESGVGLAIDNHPNRAQGLRIGVVGMGTATLAAYVREIDTIRFYEINPAIPRLSAGLAPWFRYLSRCPGTVEVAMGDARLTIEREQAERDPRRFDVLALDAFSSDAIPVHLLTEEAFDLFLGRLREPGGILAVHISNRYLDLVPVVHGYAERRGLPSVMISAEEDDQGGWTSDWILIARSDSVFNAGPIADAATPWDSTSYHPVRPWTDQYSNLLSVLRSAAP